MYMYVAFSCTLHAAACLDCLYLLLGWLRPTYEQYVCQNMSNMFARICDQTCNTHAICMGTYAKKLISLLKAYAVQVNKYRQVGTINQMQIYHYGNISNFKMYWQKFKIYDTLNIGILCGCALSMS